MNLLKVKKLNKNLNKYCPKKRIFPLHGYKGQITINLSENLELLFFFVMEIPCNTTNVCKNVLLLSLYYSVG